MIAGVSLFYIWTVMAVLALAGIVAIFVWAVKAGQFSHQDRASRLALRSGIPDDPPEKKDATP